MNTRQSELPTLRIYLRRSRADEGHQQFSLDVQREGAHRFARDQLSSRGIELPWTERVEYVDDDRAGDDFIGRTELRRLMKDTRRGDVIVCRDQSRIGRDALEVTLVIRDLVRDLGARLFYYADGQAVVAKTALDQAMTFVRGTGHQMELEAIRSRTREHLRSRVLAGRIAGGSCYGYKLQRIVEPDRKYTIAVIDDEQAAIVRRIYAMFIDDHGLKKICRVLNAERIPSPRAGRRGTGSWCPNAIRSMLQNPRYRGVYIHGRVNRVRRGGRRISVEAPPEDIITVEIPTWRIIDDAAWAAVQDRFADTKQPGRKPPGPATRYALSGLGRCAVCNGAISALQRRLGPGRNARVYGCAWHHQRGNEVCQVKVRQPIEEVEGLLAGYLADKLLTEDTLTEIMQRIRKNAEQQVKASAMDVSAAEAQLQKLRSEQRNLATAVAAGGDSIPELVSELRKRNERIRLLEADVAAAKRAPEQTAALLRRLEGEIRSDILNMRETLLADPRDAREVFSRTLREGLYFIPDAHEGRAIWRLRGRAEIGKFKLKSDPDGI